MGKNGEFGLTFRETSGPVYQRVCRGCSGDKMLKVIWLAESTTNGGDD